MRQLVKGSLGSSHVVTRNTTVIPPFMNSIVAAAATGFAEDLEMPSDYWAQVKKSNEIWPIYGGQTGKFADPIVSTIMDMYVSLAVSFGSETLLKDVDVDSDAKKVLDHWSFAINQDDPLLTNGLDVVREQMHRGRWGDGGVVIGWGKETRMQTFDGVKYLAPDKVVVYPRTMFEVMAGETFGDMELILKTDTSDYVDTPSEEVDLDTKRNLMQNMLKDKRCQVVDRNRQESSQKYPVPFLIGRGLHAIAGRIRVMQRGDYETVARILRAILLITQGADAWLESDIGWQPPDAVPDLASIVSAVTTKDTGYHTTVGAPYSTKMEWILPDLQGLLANEKFAHDDFERMAALGILEVTNTGQRRSFVLNPKPLIMEIWSAMRADKRFVEGTLFAMLAKLNPKLFSSLPNFYQKPVTIFWSEAQFKLLEKMYEWGLTTFAQTLEHAIPGADIEATVMGHKYEEESGIADAIKPRTVFQQSVEDGSESGDGDNDSEEEGED